MPDNDDDDLIKDHEDIVIEDDQGDDGDEPKIVKPEDGFADLQRQLDLAREERAREQRERMAEQNARISAERRAEESEMQLVSSAIDTLAREAETLKAEYAYALRNGDHARAAEINAEMLDNSQKKAQLETGYEAMKAKPKIQPVQPPSDPVEAFAAMLSPKSADWVRAHPEYVRDPRLNRKMIAAHELAIADGHAADSDAYFEAIEDTLKIRQQAPKPVAQEADASSSAAKVVQRRDAAPAAAPVSRGSSGRENVVRLTAAEREMAELMGMKPEEYARNKIALKKEGKLQ